jgi:extracellular elastinolytic metalloproteinase
LLLNDDDVEHTHVAFCSQLENEVLDRRDLFTEFIASQGTEQTVLNFATEVQEAFMGPIEHLYESNCAHTHKPYQFAVPDLISSGGGIGDSKRALLQFMIAATPNDQVLQDILSRYDDHLERMTSSFEVSFVGDHQNMVEHIDNVPDAVNPVKAKLAYVQVPKGEKTILNLVWKVRLIIYFLSIGANRNRSSKWR